MKALELAELPELADNAYGPLQAVAEPSQRIVVLGGGTGLSTMLRGLRHLCFPTGAPLTAVERERLTAIVTVADDGGSSGLLRQAYPMLAPGDIRACLLALAGNPAIESLFDFRFNGAIGSHSLGNLILTALAELESDFTRGVERASELLDVRGRVLPATPDNVVLQARFHDGSCLRGETCIRAARKMIDTIELVPCNIRTLPEASEALAQAGTIVLGPGSLYTSILPTLLVPGISEAIADSKARVVLVMNLMTEPGETDSYDASDFLHALRRHAPRVTVHCLLQNNTPIPHWKRENYEANGAEPIGAVTGSIPGFNCQRVARDLLANSAAGTPLNKIRHDPDKLARAILEISRNNNTARLSV